MLKIALTADGWWAVQNLVRRSDRLGELWDVDDMLKVHQALLNLVDKPPDTEYELEFGRGWFLQVEAQVPQTLDLGRSNIGRRILLKVFAALSVQEEGNHEPVPAVFLDASDYTDDLAGSDAGAEGKSA